MAKTSPTHISVRIPQNNISLLDQYEQYVKLEELQNLLLAKQDESLSSNISKLLDDNTGMIFSISGLEKQSSDYVKTKFSFAKENGQMHVFKIKDEKIQQISINEFIEFYKQKYNNHYQVLHEKAFEEVQLKTLKNNTFSEIKDNVLDLTEQYIKNEPIHFGPVDEDGITELTNAFLDNEER